MTVLPPPVHAKSEGRRRRHFGTFGSARDNFQAEGVIVASSMRPPFHHDVALRFRRLAAAVLIGLAAALIALPALAGTDGTVSPDEALQQASRGELTIIDIRRPDEWRASGVPAGAAQATVNFSRGSADFLARIRQLTDGDKSAPIALICAGGVRSRHAARLLRSRGYDNVLDIDEGMFGSAAGPGWLRRELPLEACSSC